MTSAREGKASCSLALALCWIVEGHCVMEEARMVGFQVLLTRVPGESTSVYVLIHPHSICFCGCSPQLR